MVRTVTTREPEWDDESRAYVLALAEYERSVCGGCGGWLPETTDPKNEGRYVSKGAIRCHRCDVLHAARSAEEAHPAHVAWPIEKV